MNYKESLKLERYKFVTLRQGYFTDLSKETFITYSKIFSSFIAGAITLISVRIKLDLDQSLVNSLLKAIAILISFIGVISIFQIIFCLKRWYGFRYAECDINPDCPRPEFWAWLFEGFYILGIVASIIVVWWGIHIFIPILNQISRIVVLENMGITR